MSGRFDFEDEDDPEFDSAELQVAEHHRETRAEEALRRVGELRDVLRRSGEAGPSGPAEVTS
jgi:hypothetical protein